MNDILKIKQLLEDYKKAIHTQDERFFKKLWSGKDTDTMISITKQYVGIENIYNDFLIGGIQKAYQEITLIGDSEPTIHFLDETTAIIIFAYHTECIRRETLEIYGIQGLETQVVKKINDEWKLTHVHYSK